MTHVGPSNISREQLLQKLVQEFPKAFQLVDRLSTPAYGHDAPADTSASQPQQSGGGGIVSAADFKVELTASAKAWVCMLNMICPAHQQQTTTFPRFHFHHNEHSPRSLCVALLSKDVLHNLDLRMDNQ